MTTMTSNEQRVAILRRLIDTTANGNVARFAREHSNHTTSLDATYLRQLLESYVDADNSFGAKLRNPFTCDVEHVDGDNWRLINLDIRSP